MCSSSSFEARITASGKPPSSRILRASMLSRPGRRSPGGRRSVRGPAAAAPGRPHGMPHALERVVGIDQEDAIVGHRLGVGAKRLQFVVETHDPTMGVGAFDGDAEEPAGQHVGGGVAAADVCGPAGRQRAVDPWARRRPNSSTGSPRAAITTRAALVATSVWKLMMFSSADSSSCACSSGPLTRSSGSCGKTTVPSGMASTSQVNRSWREEIEEGRIEERPAVVARQRGQIGRGRPGRTAATGDIRWPWPGRPPGMNRRRTGCLRKTGERPPRGRGGPDFQ